MVPKFIFTFAFFVAGIFDDSVSMTALENMFSQKFLFDQTVWSHCRGSYGKC